MRNHKKKIFKRFISFATCFLITAESLAGYGSITANAVSVTDSSVVSTEIGAASDNNLEADTTSISDTNSDTHTDTSSLGSENTAAATQTDNEVATGDTTASIDEEVTERVSLNTSNFPDEYFLSYICENFDQNDDNTLSKKEIDSVTKIDVSNMGIVSLEGLSYFIALEELDCSNNQLTTLELGTLTKLVSLDCSFNRLIGLDLTKNSALTALSCLQNARDIQIDENSSFYLTDLKGFSISDTTDWTCEYTVEDTLFTFSDDLSSNIVSYSVNTVSRELTEEPVIFTLVLYTEDFTEVAVDEATFPDSAFRDMLLSSYDIDKDKKLSSEEGNAITNMDISSYGIKDLTGITHFTNLVYLNYSISQSEELDFGILSDSVLLYCDKKPVLTEDVAAADESASPEATESADTEQAPDTAGAEDTLPSSGDATPIFDANGAKVNKVTYDIIYKLNGGTNSVDAPETFIGGETVTLPIPSKKGFQFDCWYLDSNYATPITIISTNTASDVTVYAKWTQLSVSSTTKITSAKAAGKGKMSVSYQVMDGVKGYEILCSTSKNFKDNIRTMTSSKTSLTIKNLIKNKTYYVKVRGYLVDSSGEKVYGAYSLVKKVKIKSGVSETTATASSAKISSTKITDKENVTIKAKTSKIVKSKDTYYYLFALPSTQTTLKKLKPIAKAEKSTSFSFTAPLDKNGNNSILQSKFVIAVKQKSGYKIISSAQYISNPEGAADYTYAFPTAPTKKGLQGYESNLGINHTVINIEINDLIATKNEYNSSSTEQFSYKGKTYYFRRDAAAMYANTAKSFANDGATVYAILLLGWSSKTNLITPAARTEGYAYYAWNMKEQKVKEQLEATMAYFADYCYSLKTSSPVIAGWIVGNEVDNFDTWNYAGTSNFDSYAKTYADTFRLVYNATKSVYSNARVYISLDHMWAMSNEGSYGSKAFLEKFNSILKSEGNIDWDIAYHPYPVPLTDANFWNNDYLSNNENSPIVNMKNLSVLTNYVKKHYGKDKRVILSEVGFTSNSGKKVQAAAIAYAYYVAEFNPMVDAIMMRSLHDAQVEVDQGLSFGITGKPAYNVYKYMDTPKSESYTKSYLKVIGAKSWKSIVPNYKASKFKKMPSR
ncbi:DUF5722 domain-containing protein [Konateibacter massiliensis]|uniref:DUF5722 domain-containing protein n=1 Tax=Konateibacter massiliensis TaxID=2002841 RepID=UPI0015D5090B|nr:DUF5722 domain-containing protein [Konateibacter massiliensis]